jgi:hypothetical protein
MRAFRIPAAAGMTSAGSESFEALFFSLQAGTGDLPYLSRQPITR